jgi:transaldolase
MKIFLDTADLKQIRKYKDMGIIDGVTTNPTILSQHHTTIEELVRETKFMPLSLEVSTNNLKEMIIQARQLNDNEPNVVIKIPVENEFGEPCFGVIRELEGNNIKVNATAVMSFGQVMLAAKVGATYISIFAGRIADEGGNSSMVIAESAKWLKEWGYKSQIIVGSIRSVGDIINAALSGAHIITIPPQYLEKLYNHNYTRETVKQFIMDANK